jgi:hypothetical protein
MHMGNTDDLDRDFERDDDTLEIDLENPDDVKVIEQEFQKLYDEISDLRIEYGEGLLNIEVI